MKRILWMSENHSPSIYAREWLEDRFGEIEIKEIRKVSLGNAQDVKKAFEKSGCDELVLVAPLGLIQELTEQGIYPLYADMYERTYFVRFRKIKAVIPIYAPISPNPSQTLRHILWVSRYDWLDVQRAELERLFGNIKPIKQDPYKPAVEIAERFKSGGFFDIVVVAPLWTLLYIGEQSLSPIWADMTEVRKEDAHLNHRGTYYRFDGFRRLIEIRVTYENI